MKPDYASLAARPEARELAERLDRYARIETMSDRHVEEIPSTSGQWNLSRLLVDELKALGVTDVTLDGHCYLVARVPASPGLEGKPCVGFMAHVDTAADAPGKDVKPRLVPNYDGKPVKLSASDTLDPAVYEELAEYVGDTLMVTDGSTLLGADDKAGVAEIMTALARILKDPSVRHGPLEIIFTPDEETGKGMDLFPLKTVKSVACYTLDGSKGGEIESECFTAYMAKARFVGKSIHTGYARGKLANAVGMAASYVSMLPRAESPEATDGWFGFYAPIEMSGHIEEAKVDVLLRDFDDEGMKRRIEAVKAIAKAVEAQFPGGTVELEIAKQYLNMKRKLDENPAVLEKLFEAARRAGVEPYSKPIRGGTDGSRLTEMGIPTPNVFTGGHNFHSRHEWASVGEMVMACDTVVELIKLWAE
ncbi:MAG: peptidase T [Spirochaetales bacterium]|nr:peptidase T [Spirochaetales bacterium]